ncbi:MAG: DUF1631 domain-containing protein, partial [Burkholderiaceae bacterium]|nr:DUF1631 domain-containing protein [Burkholderiaceae bacterium]
MPAESPIIDDESDAPVDSRRRFELLEDCREIVVSRMSRAISEALEKMSDELTALALKKTKREEQAILLEAVSLVRQHRPEIELRFRRSFVDVFERRMFNRAAPHVAGMDLDSELALVDEQEVENRLAVTRIVSRSSSKLDPDEVLGVRARLAALVDRDWFEEGRHPASPEAVFEALRYAINSLAASSEVQSALLEAFEPYVSSGLSRVYVNVNETLKSNRVLSRIKPRAVVSRAQTPRPKVGSEAPAGAAPGAGGSEHGGGSVSGQGVQQMQLLETFEDLVRQLQEGRGDARREAARILSDPQAFGVADLPLPAAEPPLVEAIDSLQQFAAGEVAVSGALLEELLEQAHSKGSSLDQMTVEIVGMVFDYIYQDRLVPDLVKQQLLRLQVVAVKAALLDRSFFARRQHPMRRLIDRISELATDPDSEIGQDSPLLVGLREIVDAILADFDRDLAVFESALRRVDLISFAESERRASQLAELTREAQRAETLAVAQDAARSEIRARWDEATPEFARDFLDDWWAQVMADARMRPNAMDSDFEEMIALCEQLLWSVAPKSPDEISLLASMLPRLIGGLMRGLQATTITKEEREKFFNDLLQWHASAISVAKEAPPGARTRTGQVLSVGTDGAVLYDPSRRSSASAAALQAPLGSLAESMLDDAA